MITFVVSGSFKRTESFLNTVAKLNIPSILESAAQEGVAALRSATPEYTGLAAASWGSEVEIKNGLYTIYWTNTDIESGFPVAIMIQYGHGTGTGGYVHGIDYINPAIRPVFDKIATRVWKAVTSA